MTKELHEPISLTKNDCLKILSSQNNWWEYYIDALKIKKKVTGNKIRLNSLLNAKSGICREDCGYCAQSIESKAPINKYGLLPKDEIIRKALIAKKNRASTFCIATSGTKPSKGEMIQIADAIREIKSIMKMEICLSAGLLDPEQITNLKKAGVDRVNHNLNTPKENYSQITTTHSYEDRLRTLKYLNLQGIDICSGFICGMGETDKQLVDLAFDLKSQNPYSVPVNFLLPIQGTKLADKNELSEMKCLKILIMLRLLFPTTELRISAGREYHLGDMQHFGLLLVDSIFLGNYLTEKGAEVSDDFKMIELLGLEVFEEE
ncbi:MAG: biotin synthase BioB [Lactococcus sp.]